ncbi:unnamed protein product [Effrenium voratum]|nr:unnamed protein product [Effrenium voratum]
MKDTTESLGHGMGVLLHGRQREAWHLGAPLFRCASEWCDAEVPEPAPSREIVPYESKLPRAGLQSEWAKVRRRNGWEEWLPREELIPEDFSMIPDTDVMEIREKIMQAPDCGGWELYTGLTWPGKEAADCDFSVGMAVDVDGWYSATVAQYGVESIKVRYHGYDSEEWVGRDRLRRNDLEKLEEEPESRLCLAQPASRQNPLETVCCLWLVGRCWSWKSHTMGKHVYLHKDVPGLPCGYGTACRYKHNESRGLHEESGDASRNQAVDVPTKLESPVLQVGMLVKVVRRWQEYFGEVLSIRRGSEAPVQVRYLQDWGHSDDSYNDWLSIESLHVPSYADISVGMTVTVDARYAATVVDLQQGELRAPVKIRYETYNYEEWAGADRLPSTCISFLPAILSRPEDSAEDNVTICCLWLDGKCWHPSTHKSGKGWHLHQVRPDVPCINGSNCKHCAARSSLRAIQDVPSASVDRAARAARADKPSEVLPWTSEPPDPEQAERAVRKAIHVVEELCLSDAKSLSWAQEKKLQEASKIDLVALILAANHWKDGSFAAQADFHSLLAQLKASAPIDDVSGSDSDASGEGPGPSEIEDDLSLYQEGKEDTLEAQLQHQPEELKQLSKVLVFGTFRCVSGDQQSRGEVLVERGPRLLLGCRVRIPGRCRRTAYDFDRCYVRLLMGKFIPAEGQTRRTPELLAEEEVARTELYGRVLHACPGKRQKLFVCTRTKMVRSKNQMTFKPINGKLPAILVPWNQAQPALDRFDLHLVEVVDWQDGRKPCGKYLRALCMQDREGADILEVVKWSMNLSDWEGREAKATSEETEGSTLTGIGIQHPDVPAGLLFSESGKALQVHILDVNAYLDTPELEEAELLARRRAVGEWFMDHLDQPLHKLLLLPEGLCFCPGRTSRALTFSLPLEDGQLNWQNAQVFESLVHCDRILRPEELGKLLPSGDMQESEPELARLVQSLFQHACGFENALRSTGSFAVLADLDLQLHCAWQREGALGSRLVETYMYLVNLVAGQRLARCDWQQLLDAEERREGSLRLRHWQGRFDPGTWRVIERLVRCKPNSKVSLQDALKALDGILQQPLTPAQKSCLAASFHRRLRFALPHACYAIDTGRLQSATDLFHVAMPLHRYLDILGMRALKCQLGWQPKCAHMRMSVAALEQAVANANMRHSAQGFAVHIFRQIAWMRELSACDRAVKDAVVGALGPKYVNLLIPWPRAPRGLEVKVPVAALRSATCSVEYDPSTQSLKVSAGGGTWSICAWTDPSASCWVARNFAHPIPHHAAPGAVGVAELSLHNRTFGIGYKVHPEVFSSWPDLSEWKNLDGDLHTYASIWSKIRLCQVHAAAVCESERAGSSVKGSWAQKNGRWCFTCTCVKSELSSAFIEVADMALIKCIAPQGIVTLYGLVHSVWKTGAEMINLEIQLSEVGAHIRSAQEEAVKASTSFRLRIFTVPTNETKSVELLRSMPRSPPLAGLRLTAPDSKQRKRELEQRPLATLQQVEQAVQRPHFTVRSGVTLNEKQRLAVKRGLQRPFSMVQGPPGTGKTSFLVNLITAMLSLDTQRSSRWQRLLVLAPSNHAADEIVRRLLRDTSVPPLFLTRVYSRSIERADGSSYQGGPQIRHDAFDIKPDVAAQALHRKASQAPMRDLGFGASYEEVEQRVLNQSRVVVTTVTNSYLHTALNWVKNNDFSRVHRPIKFTSVIIDEAAQASEPDVVISFMLASVRVVVVGDHKQLGPVVAESNLCDSYINVLETPFLERMLQKPQQHSANTLLNVQYRMHPSIRKFPSTQFYNSQLEDGVTVTHRPELARLWPTKDEHVLFVDCQTPQCFGLSVEWGGGQGTSSFMESKTSLKNSGEAKLVLEACKILLDAGCSPSDIAIITPYNAQQQEIVARLRQRLKDSRDILVGTVHALQGSEREFIIISCVRSVVEDVYELQPDCIGVSQSKEKQSRALREMCSCNLGILSNPKLLNVSLTRARYGLVCIGNRSVLSNGSQDFLDLTQRMEERGCLVKDLRPRFAGHMSTQ